MNLATRDDLSHPCRWGPGCHLPSAVRLGGQFAPKMMNRATFPRPSRSAWPVARSLLCLARVASEWGAPEGGPSGSWTAGHECFGVRAAADADGGGVHRLQGRQLPRPTSSQGSKSRPTASPNSGASTPIRTMPTSNRSSPTGCSLIQDSATRSFTTRDANSALS